MSRRTRPPESPGITAENAETAEKWSITADFPDDHGFLFTTRKSNSQLQGPDHRRTPLFQKRTAGTIRVRNYGMAARGRTKTPFVGIAQESVRRCTGHEFLVRLNRKRRIL